MTVAASQALGSAFWRMWTATVVSRFGDAMRGPALALVAAGLTRDPRAIALVVVAGQLPGVLFGLLGGVLADRWDGRISMAATDALRCVLVLALAAAVATGHASVPLLVAFTFALSTIGTLFDASAFAILPELVPPDRLATANGRLQAGTTVAGGLLGAPAASVLFVVAAALPFAIDGVTFAVAAGLALTLPAMTRVAGGAGPAGRPGLFRDAATGVRWLVRQPALRLLAALNAVANLVIGALLAVLVLLVLDVFGAPVASYGLVTMVGSLGAIAGGLLAGRLAVLLGALPALRWVLLVQTGALGVLAAVRHVLPGTAALAVFVAGTAVWNVLANSYLQRAVPADLLGRVGSASRVVALASAPVGAALGGLVAGWLGVPAVAAGGAALFALLTVAGWRALASRAAVDVEDRRPAPSDG